jgi:hypothetical protein
VPTSPRNSAASGQLEANAKLTRLAVSLIRTAIFSNRSRMVENPRWPAVAAGGWHHGPCASANRRRCAGSGASGWRVVSRNWGSEIWPTDPLGVRLLATVSADQHVMI